MSLVAKRGLSKGIIPKKLPTRYMGVGLNCQKEVNEVGKRFIMLDRVEIDKPVNRFKYGEDTVFEQFKVINLTENAKKELWKISKNRKDQNGLNTYLRFQTTAGGCSGMKFVFNIEDTVKDYDEIFEFTYLPGDETKPKLVVDDITLLNVANGIIDYKDDLNSSEFILASNDLNSGGSCSCGSSQSPSSCPSNSY